MNIPRRDRWFPSLPKNPTTAASSAPRRNPHLPVTNKNRPVADGLDAPTKHLVTLAPPLEKPAPVDVPNFRVVDGELIRTIMPVKGGETLAPARGDGESLRRTIMPVGGDGESLRRTIMPVGGDASGLKTTLV